jgi:hypothetical protein
VSVWKDIRCDANLSEDCADNVNLGPQGFETAGELRAQGRKHGWTYRADVGDVCPACRKVKP